MARNRKIFENMKSNNGCVTTIIVILNLLAIVIAESLSDDTQIRTTTVGPADTSTATITSGDILLEASAFNETSTTSPEIADESNNFNGYAVIMYIFAIIGLTFTVTCVIQILRSSSYCDHRDQENHSMNNRSRRWKHSWRGNNSSRQYAFTDNIIAV